MNLSPSLGQRVRQRRKALRMTQQELAERARISQPRISQIENNASDGRLPRRMLRDLADALAVEPEALLGVDDAFPLDAPLPRVMPSLLPSGSVQIIGREYELTEIARLLATPGVQLVTLSGPGGVGKTLLALRAAAVYEASTGLSAHVVSLEHCRDAAAVAGAIAASLGIRDRSKQPLIGALVAALQARPTLLLLDNLEQALPSASLLIADLIGAAPELQILATSRAALRVRGERDLPIAPLALPARDDENLEEIACSPAVRLFVERTRELVLDFKLTEDNAADVAALCRRLDGLPLALELAAARMTVLTPEQLRLRIERRSITLSGRARDLPERQATLTSSIRWSFELLTADERAIFRRLAVFRGGFTFESVERITTGRSADEIAGALATLLDHNLVTRSVQADGSLRFGMLETIREFAIDRLTANSELHEIARLHLEWAVELAESAEPELFGHHGQSWLQRLDLERENMETALSWAADRGETLLCARLAIALTDYWYLRGQFSAGVHWLGRALLLTNRHQSGSTELALAHVRVLGRSSQLAQPLGDHASAIQLAQRSLELARRIDNLPEIARATLYLANLEWKQGELASAQSRHREALEYFRSKADSEWVMVELINLGNLAAQQDDLPNAERHAQEAIGIARELGDGWSESIALRTLADIAIAKGLLDVAAEHAACSLEINVQSGNRWGIADSLAAFGSVAAARDEPERAIGYLSSAYSIYQSIGVQLPPPHRRDWPRLMSRLRDDLGNEVFERAWSTASRVSPELVIEDARRAAVDSMVG